MAKKKTKKTDKKFDAGVRWCITDGWGNTKSTYYIWHAEESEEAAYKALAEVAKKLFPSTFNDVWTQSFVDGGVVCDFGDHYYFGFIEGVKAPFSSTPSYAVASGVPEELKQDVPKAPRNCTVRECLSSTWGVELTRLFQNYLRDAELHGAAWLAAHALEYCCVSSWWEMFCQDDPSISEVWEYDMTPEAVYNGVLDWARGCMDAPEILLMDSPDAKWEAFRHALLNGVQTS